MNCPKCNEKIKLTDTVCPYCGFSFEDKENTTNDPINSYSENKVVNDCNYCKNEYLDNSQENWVNDIIKKANGQKRIVKLFLGLFMIVPIIMVMIMFFSKQFVSILPVGIFVAFIIFFFSKILKLPTYVVKEYQGHTIVAYIEGKVMKVVIDNNQFETIYLENVSGEYDVMINNANIHLVIIYRFKEFTINVIE